MQCDGPGGIIFVVPNMPTVVAGRGEVWPECDRLVVVGDGSLVVAPLVICMPDSKYPWAVDSAKSGVPKALKTNGPKAITTGNIIAD